MRSASLQLDHRFLSDHPQHEPRASEKYVLTRGIPSSRQQHTPDPEPTVGEYSSPHTESLWLLRGGLDGLLLVPAGFLGDLQQLCGSYELEAWEEYVFFIQYATPAIENSPRPVSICIFLNQLFHSWRDLKANRCASDLRAALFLGKNWGEITASLSWNHFLIWMNWLRQKHFTCHVVSVACRAVIKQ